MATAAPTSFFDRFRLSSLLALLGLPQSKAIGLSTLLHGTLLFAAAAYTYEVLLEREPAEAAILGDDDPRGTEIDTKLVDFAAGAASFESSAPVIEFEPTADLVALAPSEAPTLRLATAFQEVGTGDGEAAGEDSGAGGGFSSLPFERPNDGSAVTKGSFTAFTFPPAPMMGRPYLVVIEIAVPDFIKRYPRADLSGLVVGTDNYRQELPGPGRSTLIKKDGVAQLAVPVPGAEAFVQDTIVIRSRIMKEEQTLKLTFQPRPAPPSSGPNGPPGEPPRMTRISLPGFGFIDVPVPPGVRIPELPPVPDVPTPQLPVFGNGQGGQGGGQGQQGGGSQKFR